MNNHLKMEAQVDRSKIPLFDGVKDHLSDLTSMAFEHLDSRGMVISTWGDLNITPWLAYRYAELYSSDVAISLPQSRFNELYNKYTKQFFTFLMSPRKDREPFRFAYETVLWGYGRMENDKDGGKFGEKITNLVIESRPKLGTGRFASMYSDHVDKTLKSGEANERRKIIFLRTKYSLPEGISEPMMVEFSDKQYPHLHFDPNIIILECVNEWQYKKLDSLADMVIGNISAGKKVFIHFSWPYTRGIKAFYEKVGALDDVATLHFGKAMCHELSTNRKVPSTPLAMNYSLESNMGEYYSNVTRPGISIVVPFDRSDFDSVNINAAISAPNIHDDIVKKMKEAASTISVDDYYLKSLLLYPPVIDTFSLPSEMKVGDYLPDIGYRYIPIAEYLHRRLGKERIAGMHLSTLMGELEKSFDVSRHLTDLQTYPKVTKRTLLQMSIVKLISDIMNDDAWDGRDACIRIANLHSMSSSRIGIYSMVNYLFASLRKVAGNLPRIIQGKNFLNLELDGEIINLMKDGSFVDFGTVYKLMRSNDKLLSLFDVWLNRDEQIINIGKKFCVDSLRYNLGGHDVIPKWNGDDHLLFMTFQFSDGGLAIENINFSDIDKDGVVEVSRYRRCYRGEKPEKSMKRWRMRVDVSSFEGLSYLPEDLVRKTYLLIPGPVPFVSIGDEISISNGFDSLLKPFKKIEFYAYQGRNLGDLMRQLGTLEKLYADETTDVNLIDLATSNAISRSLPHDRRPSFTQPQRTYWFEFEGDSPVDVFAKERELREGNGESFNDRKTLEDIFKTLGTRRGMSSGETASGNSRLGTICLKIQDDSGRVETVSFSERAVVRLASDNGTIVVEVDEVQVGDVILFISSGDQRSIDEYLLESYADTKDISLNKVYSTFDSLARFINIVQKAKYGDEYANQYDRMYWLTEEEKLNLHKFVQFLLGSEEHEEDLDEIMHNNIWSHWLDFEQILDIVDSEDNPFSIKALYKIAKALGFDLESSTFGLYCVMARSEDKHYYFKNYHNIAAIGKLTGNISLIEEAEAINRMGIEITPLLILIGRTISRVLAGNINRMNQLDEDIGNKLRKGRVVEIQDRAENTPSGAV